MSWYGRVGVVSIYGDFFLAARVKNTRPPFAHRPYAKKIFFNSFWLQKKMKLQF